MAGIGMKRWDLRLMGVVLVGFLLVAQMLVMAEVKLIQEVSRYNQTQEVVESDFLALNFWWKEGRLGYERVWPEMRFGWRIIVGTIIGFFGAAFGTVGGVGGGGIFVPMLRLIIGFDAKSSTAISKCMITGGAFATVTYSLKLRHPTLEMPLIDYDLALLFQPVLVLGISIGVALNVILADWMITVLLIIIFLVMSTKAFLKGVETWKKETLIKMEAARRLELNDDASDGAEYKPLPEGPSNCPQPETKQSEQSEVSILENVDWKALGVLYAVWIIILALEIAQNFSTTCSVAYWVLNLLQIPVAVGVSSYEAVCLYKGWRKLESKGDAATNWKVHQLILCCACGVLSGLVGGLLGLGGGFILGPLFLELGIPPQVSSATATFAMAFSASMSVVEYYLLKRFPVPYALYFVAVAAISALVGQYVVRKLVSIIGRASLIIFILSFTIFVSAMSLGGVGIADMIEEIENKEYMGFDNLCSS
ncbi:hypothetical protein SLA2020_478670 [Shorea laevis]